MSDQPAYAVYIGRCPDCGAIRAASIDNPAHREYVAEDIADYIKSGLVVERRTEPGWNFGEHTCALRETPPTEQPELFNDK